MELGEASETQDRLLKDHAEKGPICPCLIVNGEDTQLKEGNY